MGRRATMAPLGCRVGPRFGPQVTASPGPPAGQDRGQARGASRWPPAAQPTFFLAALGQARTGSWALPQVIKARATGARGRPDVAPPGATRAAEGPKGAGFLSPPGRLVPTLRRGPSVRMRAFPRG